KNSKSSCFKLGCIQNTADIIYHLPGFLFDKFQKLLLLWCEIFFSLDNFCGIFYRSKRRAKFMNDTMSERFFHFCQRFLKRDIMQEYCHPDDTFFRLLILFFL